MTATARAHTSGACRQGCKLGEHPRIALNTGNPLVPHVEIWQCSACGHGITLPPMDDVAPLYANRGSGDYLSRDSRPIKALKMFVFKRLARSLLERASNPVRKVADFGTGSGMLAEAFAKEARCDAKIYALDFFDEPPGPMRGVDYLSFAESERLRNEIDLLTCFHVLEHSDDPDGMMLSLKSYLSPSGTIVIEVPNVDCVWTPWFGKACANWYAPFHRVHFSRKSLRDLIERHGLKIQSEEDVCGPTFALSLAALFRVKPNTGLFMLALMLRPIQWIAERLSAQPSALRVVARDLRIPRP